MDRRLRLCLDRGRLTRHQDLVDVDRLQAVVLERIDGRAVGFVADVTATLFVGEARRISARCQTAIWRAWQINGLRTSGVRPKVTHRANRAERSPSAHSARPKSNPGWKRGRFRFIQFVRYSARQLAAASEGFFV
jgi:hypothetical protein